ncbi:MAG: hypothetical protein ACI91O_000187 [Candidatus Poriferisodalaceae bacterium]|jgi:hypothetical protein
MSEPLFSDDQSISVSASPEAVYAMVSDLTRHGEWSSQNIGGEWLDGATGQVGDWFEGRNKAGPNEWTAKVEITEATPGADFGFWTLGTAANVAHWRYTMEAEGSGTKLSQHYRLHTLPEAVEKSVGLQGWTQAVAAGMATNLAAMKKTAESEG